MPEKSALVKLIESVSPSFAQKMQKEPTKITPYPADFLRRGEVLHIACNGPYGPSLMTVGYLAPDFIVSLGSNPEGFYQLAARGGLVLDTPERRARYVKTFLDTTKELHKRTQFLDKFPDLRKTPQTTPEELKRYQALKEQYDSLIRPLSLAPQPPWQGRTYALVIWDLVQYDVTLAADGKVTIATAVVEKTLPLCLQLVPAQSPRGGR